jgi:hypothetical protein
MTKSIVIPMTVALLQLGVLGCEAHRRRHGSDIEARQERQQDRIREGRYEGDLSNREASRLRERSREIDEDRRDAREDDGRIDGRERRAIQHEQDDLNRDIYQQRHDDGR